MREPPIARRAIAIALLAGLLLLIATGTFSAWTSATDSPDGYVEAAWEFAPPANQALPTISGINRDGETLTAANGAWTGAGQPFDYEYQWRRCNASGASCVDIAGATGQQYVLTPDEVEFIGGNKTVRVRVTATSAYGSDTAESAQTAIIQARPPVNQVPPAITGAARENVTLSASQGTWDGTKLHYSYQWQRCNAAGASCVSISATQPTYVVSADDQGSTFRVVVTTNNMSYPGGGSAVATSSQTAVVVPLSDRADGHYATNGSVAAMTRSGGNTYVGGDFTRVGKPVGAFAELSLADATPSTDLPPVTGGYVWTMVEDGSGGWFIGGTFTRVGGYVRNRIAHILPNGTVDPAWNPNPNDQVTTMALSGSTLYVGGFFTTIGGQTRNHAAALSTTTGVPSSWNPNVQPVSGGNVYTLLLNGSTVYLGGAFATVNGQSRAHVAEVNATTGVPTAFNPFPNSSVFSIQKAGNTLYLGGAFTAFVNAGALARGGAAAIDVTTGLLTSWNPNLTGGYVLRMLLDGSRMYIGGEFTTAGGASNPALVGVNLTSGAVNWNPPDFAGPQVTTGIWSLAVSGSNLYAGGDFTTVGGTARRNLAAFDTGTAAMTSWAPEPSGRVIGLVASGGALYAGGLATPSTSVLLWNSLPRANAAAFDSSGAPTAWAPDTSGSVQALTAANGKIYLGGDFQFVRGQARGRLAAVDPATGVPDSWNPIASGIVRALSSLGTTVYVGGEFLTVAATARNRLAAFDTTGALTTWNPNANGTVRTVDVAFGGGQIYYGGDFTTIGGTARNRAAATNSLGTLLAWNPNANGVVRSVFAVTTSLIYLGGDFTMLGTTARNRIGLTNSTGAVQAWNANANGPVWSIRGHGQQVWAGGQFTVIGGQARTNVAALRASNATATEWHPGPEGIVRAILPDDSGVHIGGEWVQMGETAFQGYAHFR